LVSTSIFHLLAAYVGGGGESSDAGLGAYATARRERRERARQLEREALTKLERALATTALGESHRASAEPLRAA
jgi:hypothetical protein